VGDDYKADYFVVGDLVTYVGYQYSPDYTATEKCEELLGVVMGTVPGYMSHVMYEVYWFKKNKVEVVVVEHIKLVYGAP
jgi:hypothetical protein